MNDRDDRFANPSGSFLDRNRIRGTHKKPNYVIPWLRFSLNALGSWHRFAPVSSRFVFFALKLADAIGTCLFESPRPFFIRRVTLSPELIAVVYVSARSRAFLSALADERSRRGFIYDGNKCAKKNRDLCVRVMRQLSVNSGLGRDIISLGSIRDYNLVTRSWAKVWLWFRENVR